MRGRARSRVAWCIAALLAAAGAAAPSLAGGKGDMIDKSTIMLEGILKSVEAGDVLARVRHAGGGRGNQAGAP